MGSSEVPGTNLGAFGWGGANCLPVPWGLERGRERGDRDCLSAGQRVDLEGCGGNAHFMGQYGWGGMESFPIPGDYNGDGTYRREVFIVLPRTGGLSRGSLISSGDGVDEGFMPITSQINVFNWFRYQLGMFQ